jgi:catechol 2,3-dioxygenase-like lactoylglutathione lyase family enzyme
MITQLAFVTVIVRDQQEALDWYVGKLGLEKRMDFPPKNPGSPRWITVGIPGHKSPEIVLQLPTIEEHGEAGVARKLKQVGQVPTWVMYVEDCGKTVDELRSRGVKILEEPTPSPWGTSALIEDLYGSLISLVQPRGR